MRSCIFRGDIRDACGNSPFLDSVRSGDLKTIHVFLDWSIDCLTHVNLMGLACLHVAAEANSAEAIEYLCSTYSLDVNIKVATEGICCGQTPLHFARKEHNTQAIDVLMKLNANEKIKDAQGRTGLDVETRWQF